MIIESCWSLSAQHNYLNNKMILVLMGLNICLFNKKYLSNLCIYNAELDLSTNSAAGWKFSQLQDHHLCLLYFRFV